MHQFTSINNSIRRKTAAILAITALMALLLPFSVLSATITGLDGCINTDQFEEGLEYLRLVEPTCEFTITLDSEESAPLVTLQNANPFLYSVYDAESTEQIISIDSGDTLQFTPQIEAGESETYTLQPWTQEHNVEQGESTDFWFAALGDTQTKPGGSDPNPVFRNIAQHAAARSIPFLTISGDLIGGHVASADEHDAMYDRYDSVIDAITAPTFTVPGDHDTRQALDDYYSPRYGERFYSFEYQGATIIGINSVEDLEAEGEFSDADLATVESLLSAAQDSDQTIVFQHHPIIPPEWASSQGVVEAQRLTLAQLFVDYGVDLLLVGDAHGYDDNLLDSDDIPGLTGSVRQLTVGGAGGNMANYEGEHFYMMIHVTADDIEYERIEYPNIDLDITYEDANDGTEAYTTVQVANNADAEVSMARLLFHVDAEYVYAVDADGTFYEPVTHNEAGNTTRGYLDLSVPALTEMQFTFGAQKYARIGIEQTVHENGEMTYDELPSSSSATTALSVTEADNAFIVEPTAWSADTATYEWNASLPEDAGYIEGNTTYSVAALQPYYWYSVWKDGSLYKRLIADAEGGIDFSSTIVGEHSYEITVHELAVRSVGALPVSEGGAQFRDIETGDNHLHAFFVYNESKEKSAESTWADVDGDGELELVTYAAPGESVPLRVYEVDGTLIDSLYPYNSKYKKGYSVDTGDVDADGDEEIVIARLGNKKSIVKVFNVADGDLKQIDQFRALGKNYRGGTSIAVADINGDGDAEIITGTREDKSTVRIYKWLQKKNEAKLWLKRKPFTGANSDKGVVFTTGDMNSDGRDDIIVGSAEGNGMLKLYGYTKAGKLKYLGKKQTFSKKLQGGVRLETGNIHPDAPLEVLVTPAGQRKFTGQIRTFQFNANKKTLKAVARKAPFGKRLKGGVDMTTADVDGDGIDEIAVSRLQSSGLIDILNYEDGKLVETESFRPYSSAFAGGLYLTK